VEKAGVYMTSIYHPAALLRDPSKKPDTFVDLKNIQRKIRQLCPEVTLLSPIR
jgi:DNA polymerase